MQISYFAPNLNHLGGSNELNCISLYEFGAEVFRCTAQKMKFSIDDFVSKYYQTRRRLWSHLLKESLMENSIFCAVLFSPEES